MFNYLSSDITFYNIPMNTTFIDLSCDTTFT